MPRTFELGTRTNSNCPCSLPENANVRMQERKACLDSPPSPPRDESQQSASRGTTPAAGYAHCMQPLLGWRTRQRSHRSGWECTIPCRDEAALRARRPSAPGLLAGRAPIPPSTICRIRSAGTCTPTGPTPQRGLRQIGSVAVPAQVRKTVTNAISLDGDRSQSGSARTPYVCIVGSRFVGVVAQVIRGRAGNCSPSLRRRGNALIRSRAVFLSRYISFTIVLHVEGSGEGRFLPWLTNRFQRYWFKITPVVELDPRQASEEVPSFARAAVDARFSSGVPRHVSHRGLRRRNCCR